MTSEQAFTAAFQRWMVAQISQTQTAINTTFARRMIDLQVELRTAIQNAIERRGSEIAESLDSTRALLQAKEGRRLAAEPALKQRLEIPQALRKSGDGLLAGPGEPGATSPVAPITGPPPQVTGTVR